MNKKWLRAADAYLVAFLLPCIIMLVIFIARGIFPFGEESFLRTDLYHQYAPFFSEFQYKLRHGGALLYSWDIGMGVNFAALYGYYLASPLNFLLILVPRGLVLEFMSYLVIVKIGLCGLTAAVYFRRHFGRRNFGCAFFGILYAMSGYLAAYSWNIMWLDCILLFPLILLGMERLLRGGSPILYTVALGLSILSNYYISIMISLFLVLYFFAFELLERERFREDWWKRAGRFALFSLLSGGLAAVTLLPEIYALKTTASGNVSFPDTATQYFTILDMIARHLPNVETEQGLNHWPNLYCGTAVFLLLPLYFMNRRIRLREKLVYGVLLLLFYLSFSINTLNFIWHGFHYPNSLPCRQSFLYILLVLTMAYHAYLERRAFRLRELCRALGIALMLILLLQKLVTEEAFHWSSFYVGLLLVLLYFGCMYWERRRKRGGNLLLLLTLLLLTVETAVNMAVTSVTTTSRSSYIADNADVRKLTEAVRSEDRGFYRLEKVTRKTKNDGAWMNFPSVSLFSSTAYKDCSDFFRKSGMEASTNAYSITGSTPLMDMLFAVKYALYSEEAAHPSEQGLEYINASGKTYLYRNRYTLPIGYFLTEQQLRDWDLEAGNPALVQNSFTEALGAGSALHPVLGSFEGEDYVFTADEAGLYYVYVNRQKIKKVKAYYTEGEKLFDNVDRGYFLELGYLRSGEEIRLHSETSGQDMDGSVYRFDREVLRSVYERLSPYGFEPARFGDGRLSGRAVLPEDGVLLCTIPYDAGWTATVDGEKIKPDREKEGFLGLKLSAGEHEITLRYFPQGLKIGAVLSGISLLLLLLSVCLYWGFESGRPRRKMPVDGKAAPGRRKSAGKERGGEEGDSVRGRSRRRRQKALRMQGRTAKEWNRAFVIPEVSKEKEIEVPDIRTMTAEGIVRKVVKFPQPPNSSDTNPEETEKAERDEEEEK